MAVLLHERPQTAGGKTRKTPNLPKTSAVVALFAFSSRLDRDTMSLFAKTHSDEVRAAAIAATGQEVLELLHGGLRPNVLVLDALLTKPGVTEVLQEIGTMQLDPEPAVLVLVPVPEETAARKALRLFSQYQIMLRPYGMKNLFDEVYRMGTNEDEHQLYYLRQCCDDVLDAYGAPETLSGYRYAERMLLVRPVRGQTAADRQPAAIRGCGGRHRDRHRDFGAESYVGSHGKAGRRTLPGVMPAQRPPGGRCTLQWAAVQRAAERLAG